MLSWTNDLIIYSVLFGCWQIKSFFCVALKNNSLGLEEQEGE